MKTKFLCAILISSAFITGNAYSQEKKEMAKPVAKKVSVQKSVKAAAKSDWENIMTDNITSIKSLVTMGSKVVSDGNASGEAEKMMMGAQMINKGLEIMESHEHTADSMKMMKASAKSVPTISKANYEMINKSVNESIELLMKMGNKMVKDGSANNEGQKMMTGSEMLKSGMMLHNSISHLDKHNSGMHHMVIKEEKEIYIKK